MKDWTKNSGQLKLWVYHFINNINVKTYYPEQRNTSKLSNYKLNQLKKSWKN